MKREIIIFRGKRVDNGEWVYGFYYYSVRYESHFIKVSEKNGESSFVEFDVEIIPETIGQYTGLTDKNGVKIFEGDIVKHIYNGKMYEISIDFIDVYGPSVCYDNKENGKFFMSTIYASYEEIIGNIHDNP